MQILIFNKTINVGERHFVESNQTIGFSQNDENRERWGKRNMLRTIEVIEKMLTKLYSIRKMFFIQIRNVHVGICT